MRTENIPVVVVGGGSAAFEAAVAAKQAGAPRVLMLEKAPEPEFGGNARFSHTGFRWVFAGAEEIKTADQAAKWGGTAGVAFDPCYHQACNTFTNTDAELPLVALDEMSDAIAHAILTFAMSSSAVQGTDKGNKAAYDPTFRGHRAIK